jgi:hypothetical protein
MSRQNVLVGVALLGMVALAWGWFGSRGYGPVGEQAYSVATALYGVCLAQDEERLKGVVMLMERDDIAKNMTEQETRWLQSIIGRAKSGKWEQAANSARQMLKDQVTQ